MEEINQNPSQINRNPYMNKRKFQHEISDLPLPKHTCLEKTSTPESYFPSTLQSDTADLKTAIKETSNDNIHSKYNQTNEGSAKDSNSLSEDEDSIMSVANGSDTKLQHLKISPYDHHSASSANWAGTFLDTGGNSFDRLATKTCDEISMNPTYNFYPSPSFDDQQLDCENNDESACSVDKNGGTKVFEEEEALEELFYPNEVVSNSFVLSSGRWNVNKETQQGTEKLTIDKEFEQYFSMLML